MKFTNILLLALLILPISLEAQRRKSRNTPPPPSVEDSLFHGLKWRNIGPFRGGRSVASSGVVGQPMTYYMGSTGGGVWKTTDDGISWSNVSDGFFKTGTVGAIAVSESNPNLVIAGMGEHAARGVMTSMGNGIYFSTDAGKTWKHKGLDFTRHISDVVIHPTNPDIIFVAAQGAQYGPSEDRGIYKSSDGGTSWEKVLYLDATTGASSLSMDMNNPLILYAAMWQHRRYPWTMESGGAMSGLFKSTDGGLTWNKMKTGLPKEFGKAGISVSRANPERVFAVIEAEGDKGGVYRSDDAGKKWRQINSDRVNIARSWYYMEILADPQNENVVYVMNAPVMKSIDGGKTFANLPTPHGDNHHLWIHPQDNRKMINSNDGGANISNNGGKSWSSQAIQPTAQFYRVITDNQVPYRVYGGQQDNSAISIASRTGDGGIDWKDWYSVAGCESAFLAFDPDQPDVIYGGCYQGIIEKWVKASREGKAIKEYPELALGNVPADFKYRYNWNAPIISSPHDRNTIYHAGNVVFKSTDEGQSWTVVSPDLTKNEKSKQGPGGGPYTNEAAGGENYNTLMTLVESPHEEGVLWAGSDDGLIHLTRDGGNTWRNATPKELNDGIVNSIEVSPHDPATAFAVVMKYKTMDLKPYIFKTTDYGETWTKIVEGISDPHTFVRVVREDTKRPGLLYAGTETGMYISFNGGLNWQAFQLNLPVVPINDMVIQDNDLVVATAGRSFWILDDVGSIQVAPVSAASLQVIKPKDTYLLFGGSTDRPIPGLGQNPKQGVTIDYFLNNKADSVPLTLEVMKNRETIRLYSSKEDKDFKSWPGGPSKPEVLPAKKGYNRFTWDFRKDPLPAVDKVFVYGNYAGSRVGPGVYQLRFSLGDEVSETSVTVMPNPNVDFSAADYQEQQQMLTNIESMITSIHRAVNEMRSVRDQVKAYKKRLSGKGKAKDLLATGDSLIARIDKWEKNLIQPRQKTFQDVINYNNKLNAELMNLKDYVDAAEPKVTEGAKERFQDLQKQWVRFEMEWDLIVRTEMLLFNTIYESLELPALITERE
ncbi:VPS10 domain-containing protein [Muriicola soli]|uniref:Glycosyl hydrolase n=1 Tax=Muriicola soli TaxID=2507538 RepID=A0A411E6K9_9FLAO|nr:glycosyl hydrolase [Muriicola soli]QBA63153.1 glycosyl hydrolase [Muriicola soli]